MNRIDRWLIDRLDVIGGYAQKHFGASLAAFKFYNKASCWILMLLAWYHDLMYIQLGLFGLLFAWCFVGASREFERTKNYVDNIRLCQNLNAQVVACRDDRSSITIRLGVLMIMFMILAPMPFITTAKIDTFDMMLDYITAFQVVLIFYMDTVLYMGPGERRRQEQKQPSKVAVQTSATD